MLMERFMVPKVKGFPCPPSKQTWVLCKTLRWGWGVSITYLGSALLRRK
jgi:hypothetical protein